MRRQQNIVFTFQCPECKKLYSYDQPGEPLCDGPGATKSHEPKIMLRLSVKDDDGLTFVSPEEAARRAQGALLTPEVMTALKMRRKGRLWQPKDGIDPWTGEEMREV